MKQTVQFTKLERDLVGRSVYILGGGPSLRGFDFESLRGCGHVVAVNDAIFAAPWADTAITIDIIWLANRVNALRHFDGEMIAAVPDDFEPVDAPVRYVLRRPGAMVSERMGIVYTGDNSGFAALGMAIMRGASRIALLGYDMTAPGHFHAGYTWRSRYGVGDYPRWARYFHALKRIADERGIQIINCNRNSGIRCFPYGRPADIDETASR